MAIVLHCVRRGCVHVQAVGVCAGEYVPKDTRFGPVRGRIIPASRIPSTADRLFPWKVDLAHT